MDINGDDELIEVGKLPRSYTLANLWRTPPRSVSAYRKRIEEYFNAVPQCEWTKTGLALAIGTTGAHINDLCLTDRLGGIIKNALEMVHNAYEADLRLKSRAGDIFALKNFGWSDRQDITTNGQPIAINIVDFKSLANPSKVIDTAIVEDIPVSFPLQEMPDTKEPMGNT
jgi:hypothetical protein